MRRPVFLMLACLGLALPSWSRASAYAVTYDHHLEEPGALELSFDGLVAPESPEGGRRFAATALELEYGVRGWWTTELYLDGQATEHDGALFTGAKWENRFRPLVREHRVNPVLYVELEHVSGADRTMREVVGFDGAADHAEPNAVARRETEREVETKLILSSDVRGWNVAENVVAVKNLDGGAWEAGYALGVSRPLRLAVTPEPCRACRENLTLGVEAYGGLGELARPTLGGTSHYVAPVLEWSVPDGPTLKLSPGWGLTEESHPMVVRFSIAFELPAIGRRGRR